jgi:hypothetical protein
VQTSQSEGDGYRPKPPAPPARRTPKKTADSTKNYGKVWKCGKSVPAHISDIGRSRMGDVRKPLSAINGLAVYPDFGTAEAKTVVQAKPVVRLAL